MDLREINPQIALFEYIENVLKCLNNVDHVAGLFVDLPEAFDCVVTITI